MKYDLLERNFKHAMARSLTRRFALSMADFDEMTFLDVETMYLDEFGATRLEKLRTKHFS